MKHRKIIVVLCLFLLANIIMANRLLDQKRLRIVFFGDSITALRSNVERVFGQRVPELLEQQGIACEAIISGTGGSHSGRLSDNDVIQVNHGLDRFENDVLKHKPDVVVIGFGANDAYIDDKNVRGKSRIPLDKYESNLTLMIETLLQGKVSIILRTPSPFAFPEEDQFQDDRLKQYANVVRKLAKKYKVGLSDDYKLFKDYGKAHSGYAKFFPDAVHPNDEGHSLIAKNVAHAILKQYYKRKKISP